MNPRPIERRAERRTTYGEPMEFETVNFRGRKVRKTWYDAWRAGFENPTELTPCRFEDEADAYEQGQIERRRYDLMEGTF